MKHYTSYLSPEEEGNKSWRSEVTKPYMMKLEANTPQTIHPFLEVFQTIPVSNESIAGLNSSLTYRGIKDNTRKTYKQNYFNSWERSQRLRFSLCHDAKVFQSSNFFFIWKNMCPATSLFLSLFLSVKTKMWSDVQKKRNQNRQKIDKNKHFSI